MGLSHFPHGVSSFGIPIFGSGGILTTGTIFFVHGTTGSTANSGLSPTEALATLDGALAKCTADKGDKIILMPGHTETITGAGGITLDKSDVEIVGLGSGNNRPTFLMDGAATVTCLVTADDVTIGNCIFKAGHADVVVFATVSAKCNVWRNCSFIQNAANENFITVMSVGAADNDADGFEMHNCEIIQGDAADLHAIIFNKNESDCTLVGNHVYGDYDATPFAPIYAPDAEIQKNILIKQNLIYNEHDADAAVGVKMVAVTNTGWCIDNDCGHEDVAGETPFLFGAAGVYVARNYAAGVRGTASGYLLPAVDS